jgi:hypothetical protein
MGDYDIPENAGVDAPGRSRPTRKHVVTETADLDRQVLEQLAEGGMTGPQLGAALGVGESMVRAACMRLIRRFLILEAMAEFSRTTGPTGPSRFALTKAGEVVLATSSRQSKPIA